MLKELVIGCLGVVASIVFLIVVGFAATGPSSPAGTPTCAGMCAVDGQESVIVDGYRYDVKPGQTGSAPDAGNTYVIVQVRFKNTGSYEMRANPASFMLEDGSGVKHDLASGLGVSSPTCEVWSPVNLSQGASYGPKCIAFQAAAGRPAPLTLIWTAGFSDHWIKLS